VARWRSTGALPFHTLSGAGGAADGRIMAYGTMGNTASRKPSPQYSPARSLPGALDRAIDAALLLGRTWEPNAPICAWRRASTAI
jgi:hypothetical protein